MVDMLPRHAVVTKVQFFLLEFHKAEGGGGGGGPPTGWGCGVFIEINKNFFLK